MFKENILSQSYIDENDAEVKAFFDKWKVYHKVIEHNYTRHREVYKVLHDFLIKHFKKDFSILDFGCGDASFMSRALVGTKVGYYQGVDLSEVALKLAKKNMRKINCKKVFINGDFFNIAQKEDIRAEIIWVGLALHHLSLKQKKDFISQCRRIIGDKGYLMIFDPFLRKNEDRNSFINRWWEVCKTHWTAMTKNEAESIYEHVIKDDFPESLATYESLGKNYGFNRTQSLFRDSAEIYKLICLYLFNRK